MTAERIERAITPQTKAITVVHFVGIPCEMEPIAELARDRGIPLIEDCAIAVGARRDGTHVGLFGDAGCFSFYPVKHITTAEGGMFAARDPELAERVAKLRAFGVDRTHTERAVPGMYDVPSLGLNYRMSELQAALGPIAASPDLREPGARGSATSSAIRAAVAGIDGVRVLDGPGNRHYCLTVVLDGASANGAPTSLAGLNAAGVGTSLYYPQPVPRMQYYRDKYGYDGSAFPNATAISDRSIALPVGPHLEEGDAAYVGDVLRRTLAEMA